MVDNEPNLYHMSPKSNTAELVKQLQYKQNSPKNPKSARKMSQPLRADLPRGKSGTLVHHMYKVLRIKVMAMRATMTYLESAPSRRGRHSLTEHTCNGCMPCPPCCRNRTIASIDDPAISEMRMKNNPLLFVHSPFQALCMGTGSESRLCTSFPSWGDMFKVLIIIYSPNWVFNKVPIVRVQALYIKQPKVVVR